MSNLTTEKQLPTTQHAVLIKEFGAPEVMQYQDAVSYTHLTLPTILRV